MSTYERLAGRGHAFAALIFLQPLDRFKCSFVLHYFYKVLDYSRCMRVTPNKKYQTGSHDRFTSYHGSLRLSLQSCGYYDPVSMGTPDPD